MAHTPAGKHANALVMKTHALMHRAHPVDHSGGPSPTPRPVNPPAALSSEPNIMPPPTGLSYEPRYGLNSTGYAIGGPVNIDVRPVAPLLKKVRFKQQFGNPKPPAQTRQP